MSEIKDLLENSQSELLEHYAGLAAHDFNNMINAVQSAAHLLAADKDNLGEYGGRYVTIIEKTTERMLEMTTRLQKVKLEPTFHETRVPALSYIKRLYTSIDPSLEISGDKDLEIFGCQKSLANILIWTYSSLLHIQKVEVSTVKLDQEYCDRGRFLLDPGNFCQLDFLVMGEIPELLFDPWDRASRLFAVKKSVMKLNGEILTKEISQDKWSLMIRLPS